jgi:hypothetical protein
MRSSTVEGGEDRGDAIPFFVIVGPWSVSGRIKTVADNVAELIGERVVRQLEGPHTVRRELVRLKYALYRAQADIRRPVRDPSDSGILTRCRASRQIGDALNRHCRQRPSLEASSCRVEARRRLPTQRSSQRQITSLALPEPRLNSKVQQPLMSPKMIWVRQSQTCFWAERRVGGSASSRWRSFGVT